jgi:hypothetical protein
MYYLCIIQSPKIAFLMSKTNKQFSKQEATDYINKLLTKHKITVYAWSATSCGRAKVKKRQIKIPKPTNIDRFAVCLHEIFHIIGRKGSKSYEKEFHCDMYARNTLIKLGYDVTEWDKRTKWHVLSRVAMAHNRGLNHANLNAEVRAFFPEVDFTKWIGNKVFVGHKYSKSLDPKDIQLTPALSMNEVKEQLEVMGKRMEKSQTDDSTYGNLIVYGPGWKREGEFDNLSEVVAHYKLTKQTRLVNI